MRMVIIHLDRRCRLNHRSEVGESDEEEGTGIETEDHHHTGSSSSNLHHRDHGREMLSRVRDIKVRARGMIDLEKTERGT